MPPFAATMRKHCGNRKGEKPPEMKTATPREEEGRRRIIHGQPQGGGGGRPYRETQTPGRRRGPRFRFQFYPREEEGAAPKVLGHSARNGCGDPREEEGAAAIPTGSGRRRSRSKRCGGQVAPEFARHPQGGGERMPLFRSAQGGGGRLVSDRSLRSGLKGVGIREEVDADAFAIDPREEERGPRKETHLP